MKKKRAFFLSVITILLIGWVTSCTQVDITMPKGPKGDTGLSAYEFWKEKVKDGTIEWPKDQVEVVDFFKYLKGKDGKDGQNGKSAYEVWKDEIGTGNTDDPHNPGQKWDKTKNTIKDFWWFLTGASGESGQTPHIGDNGNWWIGNKDTGVPARGKDGANGQDGKTPEITIGANGNWFINGVDTGKPSKGANGEPGSTPQVTIGANGNWFINGVDTGKPSKGADGQDGQDGKDATPPTVEIGPNGNWFINGTDTGKPSKGADGQDGKTPTVTIGDNGNWFVDGVDTGKPAIGKDGKSPEVIIGENGNWWIDGKDTGKPAYGKDGQNGTNGQNGADGKSAYQLWVESVQAGCNGGTPVMDPHDPTKPWDCSKTTLADFWQYLRGKDGVNGQDGDEITVELGKPNVIPAYYNAALKEYVNPADGSVLFDVTDKNGAKAPAGATVKGLPGMDPSRQFIVGENGQIKVLPADLPNIKALSERKGTTDEVTINGETLESAANTLVPNRINTRIVMTNAYLRQRNEEHFGRGYPTNLTVINYVYERQVDGVWSEYLAALPDMALNAVRVNDITKDVDASNITSNAEITKWGAASHVSGDFSVADRHTYCIYRPVVLTADEESFTLPNTTEWIYSQVNQSRMCKWDGVSDYYFSLRGMTNFYGQNPIMPSAVRVPEIYPVSTIKEPKLHIVQGRSVLWGYFDPSQLSKFYMNYTKPADNKVWNIQSWPKERLLQPPFNNPGTAGLLFRIEMNTNDGSGSSGVTMVNGYMVNGNFTDGIKFKLSSVYPNNVVGFFAFILDPQGSVTTGIANPLIKGKAFVPYRDRVVYRLVNEGTFDNPDYKLVHLFNPTVKINVPVENMPAGW